MNTISGLPPEHMGRVRPDTEPPPAKGNEHRPLTRGVR